MVRISGRGGHWYASVTIGDRRPAPLVNDNGQPAIGIGLGIKTMAVRSDGATYANRRCAGGDDPAQAPESLVAETEVPIGANRLPQSLSRTPV